MQRLGLRLASIAFAAACAPSLARAVDETAGWPYPGTTAYANAGLIPMDTLAFPDSDPGIQCGAIDDLHGYAYFGSEGSGFIYKIKLPADDSPAIRVGRVAVPGPVTSCALDKAGGYGYFCAGSKPATLVKVALGDGDADPQVVGELSLPEYECYGVAIDPATGYGWVSQTTSSALYSIVYKVRLGLDADLPTLAGSVDLPFPSPRCMLSDAATGHIWVGCGGADSNIVKMSMGVGDDLPQTLGVLNLPHHQGNIQSGVMDQVARIGYFVTSSGTPGTQLFKIDLGAGDTTPTQIAVLDISPPIMNPRTGAAAIDSTRGVAYFSNWESPSVIAKVGLGDAVSTPTLINTVTLDSGEWAAAGLLVDQAGGYLYAGLEADTNESGVVVKFDEGGSSGSLARLNRLNLFGGETPVGCGAADYAGGDIYYGSTADPARITKVKLDPGVGAPQRLNALTLEPGEGPARCMAISPTSHTALVGVSTQPAKIIKIDLGDGDSPPVRIGTLTLDAGEDFPISAVFSPDGAYAYFGLSTTPGKVAKIALGAPNDPPQRIAVGVFDGTESGPSSAAIDAAGQYAWFGTGNGKVVKMRLDPGSSPPVRVGGTSLDAGQQGLNTALLDPLFGTGWFGGSHTVSAVAARVVLGAGDAPPAWQDSLEIYNEPLATSGGFIEPGKREAFLTGRQVVRLGLGDGMGPATLIGTYSAPPPFGSQEGRASFVDPTGDFATIGLRRYSVWTHPWLSASLVHTTENGRLSKVSFYSHEAAGHVWLSLYSDNGTTLTQIWKSEMLDTVNEGWIDVPVAPKLIIPEGDYWLAWRGDAQARVGGYVGDGNAWRLQLNDGPIPETIPKSGPGAPRSATTIWGGYLTYEVPQVSFASAGASGAEDSQPASVRIRLSESFDMDVSVRFWNIGGGNASPGQDFTAQDTRVNFAPGQTQVDWPILVNSDSSYEYDETVVFRVSDPESCRIGSPSDMTYTILNDDPAPAMTGIQVHSGYQIDVTYAGPLEANVLSANLYTVFGAGRGSEPANPYSVAPIGGNVYRLAWSGGEFLAGQPVTVSTTAGAGGSAGDIVPCWVDSSYAGSKTGTLLHPFNTIAEGVSALSPGGRLIVMPGGYPESIRIAKAMQVSAPGGNVLIGGFPALDPLLQLSGAASDDGLSAFAPAGDDQSAPKAQDWLIYR